MISTLYCRPCEDVTDPRADGDGFLFCGVCGSVDLYDRDEYTVADESADQAVWDAAADWTITALASGVALLCLVLWLAGFRAGVI